MTEFEKAMKPYEKWVNDKLDQIVPRPDKITPEMCAAMIAQYQRELASDGALADVVGQSEQLPEYNLNYCPYCCQMTNHLDNKCQKH